MPSRATYGRLSPSWPVEALGSLSFTSLCMCSCTKQSHLWSPVTSLAGGCGMTRSCVLGANARFPSLLTRLCQGRVGEYKAMRNLLRLRQVGGQLSPNCMLDFTLGASALKQLLLSFFPTCQVRVVRFYHSCSPSSPSPSPPSPSPEPLLPLPCPLPPCQLFAKLFANFRTQWALLDPQPGTCRVQ